MAHELELDNQGMAKMFYTGEVPWHGLGTKLDNVATAAEAIQAAGLDWEVELAPAYMRRNGKMKRTEDKFILLRKDDDTIYNIVSKNYVPVQNIEAFQFFDAVTGTEEAKYNTAGSLRNGAIVWMLAQMNHGNGSVSVKGEQIDKYVVLTNSHNGEFALQMFWSPIRVVCMNTLKMSMEKGTERFYHRHTSNIKNRLELAQEIMGFGNNFYNEWAEQANYLADKDITKEQVKNLLKIAFGLDPDKPEDNIWKPTVREMEVVEELIYAGKGNDNPKIQGTAWQAYNGITEYVDYHRATTKTASGRLQGVWFGSGNDMKNKAWKYLLNMN